MTPTTALVLETNNLRGGGADHARIVVSLRRLLSHLGRQTRPLASLDELVVTHDGLSEGERADLCRAAGAPIRFVELAPEVGYYQAKNRGFEATTAEVVAFADADCWPEPRWLEKLIAPFEAADVQVVAGRTSYRGDVLGIAATTIDFMYFPSPLGARATRNFYANNVAFLRSVFDAHRYLPMDDVYRGHCQVLGLRLQAADVEVRFEPAARTTHRFPDSARELVKLRLLRGADTAALAPHLFDVYLPRLAGAPRPVAVLGVLAARFGFSLRALGRQEMPEVSGLRRAACVGLIGTLSLLDAAGALGIARPGAASVLSYHGDAV